MCRKAVNQSITDELPKKSLDSFLQHVKFRYLYKACQRVFTRHNYNITLKSIYVDPTVSQSLHAKQPELSSCCENAKRNGVPPHLHSCRHVTQGCVLVGTPLVY